MRFLTTAVLGLVAAATVSAEPIRWSYSTGGYTSGVYEIDATNNLAKSGELGAAVEAVLIGGYVVPNLAGPLPATGPAGSLAVTLTDTATGAAGTIDVPFTYTAPLAVPATESSFAYQPQIDDFVMKWVTIGAYQYELTPGADRRGVLVTVLPADTLPFQTVGGAATPEPATLLLAAVGLAGVAVRRRMRR